MEGQTHYDILGVPVDANQDKIHRAYTWLLKEAQNAPDTPEHRQFMARAKIAYQVLSRPESRAAYHEQMEMVAPELRKWELPKEDSMHPAFYVGLFTFLFGIPGLVAGVFYAWFTRKSRADN